MVCGPSEGPGYLPRFRRPGYARPLPVTIFPSCPAHIHPTPNPMPVPRPSGAALLPLPVAVVAALAWGTALHGQVIRSYEALDQAAGEAWYTTLGFSLDASGGNVDYTELDVSGAVGYRGERNFVRLYPAYRVRSQDGARQEDEKSLHLRYSHLFSEVLRSFTFVQYQSDLALELDRRLLVGGGMRRRVVELEGGGVDVGLGVMWESERVVDRDTENDWRGANLLVVSGRAGDVDLNFTGFYQPRLDNWADVRLAGSGTAAVPLGSRLALTVAARWRKDTDPPAGVLEEDYGVTVGLRFSVD